MGHFCLISKFMICFVLVARPLRRDPSHCFKSLCLFYFIHGFTPFVCFDKIFVFFFFIKIGFFLITHFGAGKSMYVFFLSCFFKYLRSLFLILSKNTDMNSLISILAQF